VLIIKLDETELLEAYPKCRRKINKAGWIPFFLKYSRHNTEATREFVLVFDGTKAIIGDMELIVSYESIA
jgi:hypothetical protein